VRTTRRERMRDATLREIKQVARAHLQEHGPAGISLRGIARSMGMTAPALYRYFGGLNDLLAAMIEDYTNEMCDAMEAARDALPADDVAHRLLVVTRTFRRWGLDHRPEFSLIFGAPMPGFSVPEEGGIHDAGTRCGGIFLGLLVALWRQQPFPLPPDDQVPPALGRQMTDFAVAWGAEEGEIPLGLLRLYVAGWVRLYGLVAMEIFGQVDFMLSDVEPLFEAELHDLAVMLGIKAM
jgi:AcrR family transcriptional regulator